MARKKTEEVNDLDEIFNELADEHGGFLLEDYGPSKYYVDTGNLAINYICAGKFIGGGIPGGKITEIYGPPAASKSLLGMTILHGAQMAKGFSIFVDLERAVNKQFAMAAGHVNPKQLVVVEPFTIEGSFLKMTNMIEKIRERKGPEVPIVFVYDSIGAVPCEREFRETGLPENYTKAQFDKIVGRHEQPGERARISGNELRKINPILAKQNATLVIINQTRQKLNVMFGNPIGGAGGGKALEFFGSCKLWVQAQKKIVKKMTEKLSVPLGVNVKIRNEKNRSFDPFWETDNIQLFFRNGINPLGGLLGILIKSERVKQVSSGNYTVEEPYACGKEIKFKSSQDRNDVPVEVLLDCPSLIDGTSREEVESYLSTFGAAINLTDIDSVEETEVEDEEESQE